MSENNGMITKIWGPPAWVFLHSVTMGYPVECDPENKDHIIRKNNMISFFNSIGHVLPCKYCRESYNEYINELPIENHLETRIDLAKWLYDIHNKVNYKLGIPLCDIPEFIEIYDRYEQYRAKCTITEQTTQKQREINKEKGCVVPHDGIPKTCSIEIKNIHGDRIHDCKQKPNLSHNILISFYEGKETSINKRGIDELLEMPNDKLVNNPMCIYLLFPQLDNCQFKKLPTLDEEIIRQMKENEIIQKNLVKSCQKVLLMLKSDNIEVSYINIISYMLNTIMLIGNQEDAMMLLNIITERYHNDDNFLNVVNDFSFGYNILEEWFDIVT